MAALFDDPWRRFPGLQEAVSDNLAFAREVCVVEWDADDAPTIKTMKKTEYLDVTIHLRIRRQDLQK